MGKNGFGFDKDIDREALFNAYEEMSNGDDSFDFPTSRKKQKKEKQKRKNAIQFADNMQQEVRISEDRYHQVASCEAREEHLLEEQNVQKRFVPYRMEEGSNREPVSELEQDSSAVPPEQPAVPVYDPKFDYNPAAPIILRTRDSSEGKRNSAKNPKRLHARINDNPAEVPVFDPREVQQAGQSAFASEMGSREERKFKPLVTASFQNDEERYSRAGSRQEVKTSVQAESKGWESAVTKIFALIAIIVCVAGLVYFVYAATPDGSKKKENAHENIWQDASSRAVVQQTAFIPDKNTEVPILVNETNPLDENYKPEVVTLKIIPSGSGMKIDAAAQDALAEMVEAMKTANAAEGLKVITAYQSYSFLKKEYNRAVAENKYVGMTEAAAQAAAALEFPKPGCTENQLGTSIVLSTDGTLQKYFDTMDAGKWLAGNCADFGFILRYPKEKASATGHAYEPYRYRYVGKDAANYMKENNYCIEEYIIYLQSLKGTGD